jgi:radical SAM protein with 4Fe4S-binding SPASM domain
VDLVAQLRDLGSRLLTLSGGEPTVRSDWPVVAGAARNAGMVVNMVTNGQADPEKLTNEVGEAGLANVAVSLDGFRGTHDSIRRAGSFDRATAAIHEMAAAGIWVDVMFTANRRNLSELDAVYRLTWELGARRLRVQLGKPMGNQTHRDDLTLRPAQLLTLLPALGRLAVADGPIVRIGDSVGYFSREEKLLRGDCCAAGHWTGCYAGCRSIGIQADGGIKGCLSLQPRADEADPFVEGNVRERSLAEIWQDPHAFAYNRDFHVEQLAGACRQCTHARICRGGAKCVAHAYTGTFGCDPMCYYAACEQGGHTRRVWPLSAAAAAAALLVGLGSGCASRDTDDDSGTGGESGTTGSDTSGGTGDGTSGTGGAGSTGGGSSGTATVTGSGTVTGTGCATVNCDLVPEQNVWSCCCDGLSCGEISPADFWACCCEDVICDTPDYAAMPPESE